MNNIIDGRIPHEIDNNKSDDELFLELLDFIKQHKVLKRERYLHPEYKKICDR